VERCSVAILDGLPDKMGDPCIPAISCLIGTQNFDQALCDLGASVSIMPRVIYDRLSHDSLVPTSMHLQLVDQSIHHPVRIEEDVLMNIKDSFILVDFVVLDMDVYRQTPLILGRPVLSTVRATIDVAARIIKLNIMERRRPSHSSQRGQSTATKPKFMWHVKNAMSTTSPSPIASTN
jgi:hypothetical protein